MNSFLIRPAQPNDAAMLSVLARTVFAETYGAVIPQAVLTSYLAEHFALERMAEMLGQQRYQTWVAFAKEEMIGYLQFCLDEANSTSAELSKLYLVSAWHGQGVAQGLLRTGIEALQQQGILSIWLYVWKENQRAIAFYQKAGFTITGESPVFVKDVRFEDWVMHNALASLTKSF